MPDAQTTYLRINLNTLHAHPDNTLIHVLGRYHRYLHSTELCDQHHELQLIGEPFDWIPEHNSPLEIWGELWHGTRPRLFVHDARLPGDTTRTPKLTPNKPVGATLHLHARVIHISGQAVALTADHHTYLLNLSDIQGGLYYISGEVASLLPPRLRIQSITEVNSGNM